jgi:glycerol kinase
LKYIAALDQGTTSTRCIIFDRQANTIAVFQIEHQQIYPQPGWVEHDPDEILNNSILCLHKAVEKAGISFSDIAALGITNQRETTVLWNKRNGKPYGNAVVWQDTRTSHICDQLINDGIEPLFRQKTGLPIATYFSGLKIKWILDHHPALREDIEKGQVAFGNIDSWLIWNLSGGPNGGSHVSDVSNASRTMLMDLKTLRWDDQLCAMLDIPKIILPEIVPSSFHYGDWRHGDCSIPICGDLGDQQAALFGQACFNAGEAKNTYGTGCFMLLNTGEKMIPSQHGLLTTVGYQLGDSKPVYCLEGSIAVTGALVQWLRDNLKMISNSAEIERMASSVNDNGGVYFVPAFSGLFAPYWRSDARGLVIGLTQYANRGHFARAALEATAYQTKEVLDAMERDSNISLTELRVDGGMVSNNLLMQFQSDVLNVPVIRPVVTETTALGAAYAAGLNVGYWNNLDDLRRNWQEDKRWTPAMPDETRKKLYNDWKRAVQRTMGWIQ